MFQEKKLKENHAWFLGTVNLFKPPNQKSREALDAKKVKIGSRQLTIQPELKEAALKTSSVLVIHLHSSLSPSFLAGIVGF